MSAAVLGWLAVTAWRGALVGAVLLVAARYTPSHAARRLLLVGGLAMFVLPGWAGAPFTLWSLVPETQHVASVVVPDTGRVATALLLLYLSGVIVSVGRLVRQHVVLRAELRAATHVTHGEWLDELRCIARNLHLRRVPELFLSEAGTAPRACGIMRSRVLVPAAWLATLSPAARRAVLTHELAHHGRHDLLVNVCAALVVTVWWFHPVAWLLAAQLRHAAEEACDDIALAHSAASAADYGAAIVAAARACAGGPRIAAALAEHPLRTRLLRISAGQRTTGARWQTCAACLLLLLLLPASSRPQFEPPRADVRVVQRIVARHVSRDAEAQRRVHSIPSATTDRRR